MEPSAFIIEVSELILGRHQVLNNAWKLIYFDKLTINPQWPVQTYGPVPHDDVECDHLHKNWTREHNMPDRWKDMSCRQNNDPDDNGSTVDHVVCALHTALR
ncbi:hypothetical protein E4U52_003582 [Claviceps spartinae]|nr:hypothetical protein E4U52_003582 [Claviceps spartinae]